MTVLFIIGITLLALFALSLLARRFEKAANWLRWLARPFSIFGWACLQGSLACKKRLDNALEWPPKANVIARIVYLVVALFVYAGDFALARLRSAAFFGVTAGKLAWLPLDNFSGLLWLCVSALWGIVLLDLIDLIPTGWRLLPVERLSKIVRLIATLLALVLFVVSALTMAYFVLWGQMQIRPHCSGLTSLWCSASCLAWPQRLLYGHCLSALPVSTPFLLLSRMLFFVSWPWAWGYSATVLILPVMSTSSPFPFRFSTLNKIPRQLHPCNHVALLPGFCRKHQAVNRLTRHQRRTQ